MKKYDVIVIGSGLAGSLFAYLTASARLSVLIIEKNDGQASSFRMSLSPDCMRLMERLKLQEEFNSLPHTFYKNTGISFDSEAPVVIPLDEETKTIRNIDKEALISWLREKAINAGAEYLTGIRCKEIDFARRLMTDDGEFHSKVLVGADGRNSWAARMAGFPLKKIRRHKTAWTTDMPFFGDKESVHYKFFNEGYLRLLPISDTHTDTCVLLNKDSTHAPQKFINEFFPGNEHLSWHSRPHAITNPAYAAQNNILLLGDAGKVLEPFTGQGAYLAFRTAEIAAKLTIETQLKGGWGYLDDRYNYTHRELYQNLKKRNRIADFLIKYPKLGAYAVKYAAKRPVWAAQYLPCFSGLEDLVD